MYIVECIELLEPSNGEVLSGLTNNISYYFYRLFILYEIQIGKSHDIKLCIVSVRSHKDRQCHHVMSSLYFRSGH